MEIGPQSLGVEALGYKVIGITEYPQGKKAKLSQSTPKNKSQII